jgi:hypothetical protein
MYGSDINLLHVIAKPIGAPFGTSVWNKTGNQGDVWRHGQATVQATSKFQVRFTQDSVGFQGRFQRDSRHLTI